MIKKIININVIIAIEGPELLESLGQVIDRLQELPTNVEVLFNNISLEKQ
jgi:hypothetical protein